MARGTQHRKRRPQANARVAQPSHTPAPAKPKRVQHQKWEDQLFFARLRNHGRFLWYLLAVALIAAFVLLGVGSGSTGISQIVQNFFSGSSSSGTSLSHSRRRRSSSRRTRRRGSRTRTQLQAKSKLDEAAAALTTYTTLKPGNEDALRQLAAIYLRRASDWQTIYTLQQQRTQAIAPSPTLSPKTGTPLEPGGQLAHEPARERGLLRHSAATSNAYEQFASALTQREDAWKKIAALAPKDASTQLSLAQAAQDAADTKTAIAGYKAYLKLAPADAGVPAAKKALEQLEATLKSSASSSTTTTGK